MSTAVHILHIGDREIRTDGHGFLQRKEDWDEAVAQTIAASEGIVLSPDHWQVVHYVRHYYGSFNASPALRPLVKYLSEHWGPDKGNSLYLHKLFREPAKQACKIAGLPKPARCL